MNTETAYLACEEITRREAKNFGYGIRLLRVPERHALSSVYALARRIDDIGDGTAAPDHKLVELAAVRRSLHPIPADTEDPVLVAVAAATRQYHLPLEAFDELIDGCERDVRGTSYTTFDDLVVYCRLAGSVCRRRTPSHSGARLTSPGTPLTWRTWWPSNAPASTNGSSGACNSSRC
jgi:phytoene synthase